MTDSTLSTDEQVHSIWELGRLTAKQLGKKVWQGVDEHNLLGRGSELAYNYLLAIFPLLLFLLALFGLFAERGTQLKSDLFFYLSRLLPPSAADLLGKTINEVTSNGGGQAHLRHSVGAVFGIRRDEFDDLSVERRVYGP